MSHGQFINRSLVMSRSLGINRILSNITITGSRREGVVSVPEEGTPAGVWVGDAAEVVRMDTYRRHSMEWHRSRTNRVCSSVALLRVIR